MLKREAREEKAQRWLEHLQAWQAQGGSLGAYVRARGLREWEAYRWQRILRREGRWHGEPTVRRSANTAKSLTVPPQFVRVQPRAAVTRSESTLLLAVRLANDRCVELAVRDPEQLVAVLTALERAA